MKILINVLLLLWRGIAFCEDPNPYYYYKLGINPTGSPGLYQTEKVQLQIVPGLASVGLKGGVTPFAAQIEVQGQERAPWFDGPQAWLAKTAGANALTMTQVASREDLFDWVLPVFQKDQEPTQSSVQVPWIQVLSIIEIDDAVFERHGLKVIKKSQPQTTCGSPVRVVYYAQWVAGPVTPMTAEKIFKAAQGLYADCEQRCWPNPGLGFP